MKKIMIIGAGENQLPLILKAKEMGFYVIVVSIPGDYPGFSVADECLYENIFNVEKILEYAKRVSINGVISDQSDMATPIVAKIAESLGLPTYGYKNALLFTDKVLMRDTFKKAGLPIPNYSDCYSINDAKLFVSKYGFPCIIKPADSFSSRGVFTINSSEELELFFSESLSFSRCKKVIIERFIKGKQFFSQGYVEKGELFLFAFSDRYYHNLKNLSIPYNNVFPANIPPSLKERMREYFSNIINITKPLFGQVWMEWILDEKTDILYPVEMALRGAGAFVTSDIIPAAYWIDTQEYLLRNCVGDFSKHLYEEKLDTKSSGFYSFLLHEGTITKIEGIEKIESIVGVFKVSIKPIQIGDIVPPIKNKTSRYGIILIKGKSRSEIDKTLLKVKKTLIIETNYHGFNHGIIWE